MLLQNKKILFLAPSFFGYEADIAKELRAMGAEVLYFNERPDNSFLTKTFVRLNLKKLIQRNIDRHYGRILDHEFIKDIDYLFIVSPEAIAPKHLSRIRALNPCLKIITYYWDSIKNKKNTNFLIDQSDRIYSFDKGDCSDFEPVRFLPLFYTADYQAVQTQADDTSFFYEIFFVGTAHSDRYKLVSKVTSAMGSKRAFLFFYSPSKVLFLLKKLFDKNTRLMPVSNISFSPLSKTEILNTLAKSSCIIDIHHPKQTGLTMRTIEMLGAGKKLVTTNNDVRNYDFYKPENIFVIDRNNPAVEPAFLRTPYAVVAPDIYKKYSLNSWLKTIFEIQE